MPVVTTIPATKPRYAAEKTKQKKQNRKNAGLGVRPDVFR